MGSVDTAAPEHRDRTTGLVAFGILVVLTGVLCAAMIPLTLLVLALQETLGELGATPMSARTVIPGLTLYGALAVVLVWLGIGSIRARRWARPLLLVIGWLWLATGVVGLVVMVLIAPQLYADMVDAGALPAGAMVLVQLVTYGLVCVLYVILPAALVLFYRSPDVEATCRARDPRPRWTDAFPPSVLSLLVLYVLTVYLIVLMPVYAVIVPFFGTVLTGAPAWIIMVLCTAACVWLTWSTYRLEPGAWWASVVLVSVASLSAMVTFVRVSPAEFYAASRIPSEQLALLHQGGLDRPWVVLGIVFLTWASFVAYMVYVRRFFRVSA